MEMSSNFSSRSKGYKKEPTGDFNDVAIAVDVAKAASIAVSTMLQIFFMLTGRNIFDVKTTRKVLLEALEQSLADHAASPKQLESNLEPTNSPDELTHAWLDALISSKELIPSDQFIRKMKISKQAISQSVQSGKIFCIRTRGTSYYPAFYTDRTVELKHLYQVATILKDLPNFSRLRFFFLKKGSLGSVTPLEALRKNQLADVKRTAESYVEQ